MYTIKMGSAPKKLIFMTGTDHITGKTGLTLSVFISKNGGPFTQIDRTVTELGFGWYCINLTPQDTNTVGELVIHASAEGADPADLLCEVVEHTFEDILDQLHVYSSVDTSGDITVVER